MSQCPVCDADISVGDDLVVGELLECDDCGSELEIVSVNPLEIKEAPEAEEDWGQ